MCEEKLLKVLEDLDQRSGKDLEVISKEMIEEEVSAKAWLIIPSS